MPKNRRFASSTLCYLAERQAWAGHVGTPPRPVIGLMSHPRHLSETKSADRIPSLPFPSDKSGFEEIDQMKAGLESVVDFVKAQSERRLICTSILMFIVSTR